MEDIVVKWLTRGPGIIASSLLSLTWIASAHAQQAALTRAEVYKMSNQVQVLLSNRPARPAKLADVLVPQDAVKTGTRSRAELLFNEGSLARIGSNAIFRFIPGMRGFQLRNGTALIMSLPQQTATQIETPGGTIVAAAVLPPAEGAPPRPTSGPGASPPNDLRSLALAISVDAADSQNIQVKVFSLTSAIVTFTDLKGNVINLQGGQFLLISNGQAGPIQTFDLKTFYGSSSLGAGLGPGQADLILQEPQSVQPTLQTVRRATLATLEAQTRWLEGLCTLNSRGGSSTLATNCITTNADDPLRAYQDRREISTPIPVHPTPLPSPPPAATNPNTPPVTNNSNNPPVTNNPAPTGTVILIQGGSTNNNNQPSVKP
jgi:hypothetical protein